MAGYTTIGDLVRNLQKENQDAPIIYQYYLAEHFDTTEENFGGVAEYFDSLIPCLDNSYSAISQEVNK